MLQYLIGKEIIKYAFRVNKDSASISHRERRSLLDAFRVYLNGAQISNRENRLLKMR